MPLHQSRQNKTEKQSKINDQICCVRRIGSLNMLSFGLAIGSLVSCSWQWWMDGWMDGGVSCAHVRGRCDLGFVVRLRAHYSWRCLWAERKGRIDNLLRTPVARRDARTNTCTQALLEGRRQLLGLSPIIQV